MFELCSFKAPSLKVAVIGLGYVGLPIAVAFAEKKNSSLRL